MSKKRLTRWFFTSIVPTINIEEEKGETWQRVTTKLLKGYVMIERC